MNNHKQGLNQKNTLENQLLALQTDFERLKAQVERLEACKPVSMDVLAGVLIAAGTLTLVAMMVFALMN